MRTGRGDWINHVFISRVPFSQRRHPATELMKDPHDEALIAEYMEWEVANAVKQVEEVKRGK